MWILRDCGARSLTERHYKLFESNPAPLPDDGQGAGRRWAKSADSGRIAATPRGPEGEGEGRSLSRLPSGRWVLRRPAATPMGSSASESPLQSGELPGDGGSPRRGDTHETVRPRVRERQICTRDRLAAGRLPRREPAGPTGPGSRTYPTSISGGGGRSAVSAERRGSPRGIEVWASTRSGLQARDRA